MEIGYSVQTLLNETIKQAQNIGLEAKCIEHYASCEPHNAEQIKHIADCVFEIEQYAYIIKVYLENLKSEEIKKWKC